jgi:hypothetical protein
MTAARRIVLWVLNNCNPGVSDVLYNNVKARYLSSKIESFCLYLSQKPDEHTRIEPRKRHFAHAFAVKRPKLRRAVQRDVVHLDSKPTSLAPPDNSDPPPFAPREFQRTCAPPEELLVDSCFEKGSSEVLGYEKVDGPVRLDANAGDVGER